MTIEVDRGESLTVSVSVSGCEPWTMVDWDALDQERRIKERIRLGLLRILAASYDLSPSPWGILTGVRPTKVVHALLDAGLSWQDIRLELIEIYALSLEKADLLMDVARRQRPYFHPAPNNPVSVYIGIPFCPTRCSYCSFAAYPMHSHGHLLQGFLAALRLEISAVGRLLRELGLEVETIYLGGGTPTTVTGSDLTQLLNQIGTELHTARTREYTVEAGRPETLSLETLSVIREAGVGRISINPQTMHGSTLSAIGRQHTVEDVYRAFDLAREVGIPMINMDIILGLPGEKLPQVEYTLQEISSLGPDNLTVHSLAMKRASRLKKALDVVEMGHEQGAAMVNLAGEYAALLGMVPYYLYRQRHILGGLENIGYATPKTASIYNIQMMEERQTIIGLGGGGMTKLVSSDGSLVRESNPKCPATYSQQMKARLPQKMERLRQHLSG
ncbi:MAG: coproporphyrinogen dehydrogenase HemZ [Limnochordia bacterium]|nr:coproporphyrinogen dehydrogenase HemZ [Bacillota bacterium]